MLKFKHAALVGAGLLGAGVVTFSGDTARAARALPDPGHYMVGDTYKEPSGDQCMADGHAWPVKEFACTGPYPDGSWALTVTAVESR